jgi:hypothetical protein
VVAAEHLWVDAIRGSRVLQRRHGTATAGLEWSEHIVHRDVLVLESPYDGDRSGHKQR